MASPIRIRAIDAHAAGEPGRVIPDGDRYVQGETMADRLRYCQENLDWLRWLLLQEPRGYPSLCGVIVTSAVNPGSSFGIIVFEHGGFRAMSGSNTMCAVAVMIETGAVTVPEGNSRLRIDTAAGVIEVEVLAMGGRAIQIGVDNVASYVVELDHEFELPEYGNIRADVVFGGQFYVQASIEQFGLELVSENTAKILRAGAVLREVASRTFPVTHLEHPEINGVSLAMLHGKSDTPGVDARNAVVCPNGPVDLENPESWTSTLDRSPCGTGTSGRLAAKFARGELDVEQLFIHESMIKSIFQARIRATTMIGGQLAVFPTITGHAWVSAFHDFVLHEDDPYPNGFRVGDIWGA